MRKVTMQTQAPHQAKLSLMKWRKDAMTPRCVKRPVPYSSKSMGMDQRRRKSAHTSRNTRPPATGRDTDYASVSRVGGLAGELGPYSSKVDGPEEEKECPPQQEHHATCHRQGHRLCVSF